MRIASMIETVDIYSLAVWVEVLYLTDASSIPSVHFRDQREESSAHIKIDSVSRQRPAAQEALQDELFYVIVHAPSVQVIW